MMMIGRRVKAVVSSGCGLSRQLHRSSRSRAEEIQKISPRVPYPEAATIAHSLYDVMRPKGPLSIATTWDLAKDGVVSGLNSKTHLKLMLKWMRARDMLKLLCHHVGSNKKFLLTTLPEDPNAVLPTDTSGEQKRPHKKNKAKKAKLKLRKKQKQILVQKQKKRT